MEAFNQIQAVNKAYKQGLITINEYQEQLDDIRLIYNI